MASFWALLGQLRRRRPERGQPLPLAERFAHYRAIGAAYDAFRQGLERLRRDEDRGGVGSMAAVVAAYDSLAAPVHAMVRSLGLMGAPGVAELERRYEELDRQLAQEVLRARPIDYGPLVVWPAHPDATRREVVGAKAARLAQLAAPRMSVEVPPFFMVTVHGYRQFLEGSGVEDLVHRIVWTADPRDDAALETACRTAREAILDATVPSALEVAVARGVAVLGELAPGTGLVVRPSPVWEGSVGLAGAFDAPVNVGPEQVLAAFRMVLASAYRVQTLRRLLDGGLLDADLELGVIVMVTVPAQASGKVWPVSSGGRQALEVTAAQGLPTVLDGGRGKPDRFVVDLTDGSEVREMVLGRRSTRGVAVDGGGTAEVPLGAEEIGQPAVDEGTIQRLVVTWRRIARRFEGLQQLTWAEDSAGRISVLQVEPAPAVDPPDHPARRDPIREAAARLLGRVESPVEPGGSLVELAGRVHRLAGQLMLERAEPSTRERRRARPLSWSFPMPVLVLDLGGGLAGGDARSVALDQITSVPLAALLTGIADPRLRPAGPVGFDLKGFVSVVARSAADDQRFGEPSLASCARDFLHFNARLAYHFATVQSVCGSSVTENHIRFVHRGGAAEAERRELRARFLAAVLQREGFTVVQEGDRVEATLENLSSPAIAAVLETLGRLMVCSRHLDMLMDTPGLARAYAAAFVDGDYAFDRLRGDDLRPG